MHRYFRNYPAPFPNQSAFCCGPPFFDICITLPWISNESHHAKRARATGHVVLSNLCLKSSGKNGSSYCVLIQGATFTVSIVISGLLSLPLCYLENEVGKKA